MAIEPPLFETAREIEAHPGVLLDELLGPYGKRARLVRFTEQGDKIAGGQESATLRLNLFPADDLGIATGLPVDGEPVDVVAEIASAGAEDDALAKVGRLKDDPESWLTLVKAGNTFGLTLNSVAFGLFEVTLFDADAGLYVVRELDEERLPDEGDADESDADGDGESASGSDAASASAVTEINLLIVYTEKVQSKLKTDEAVRVRAIDAVARGNQVLLNSALEVRLNLVGCELLPGYGEATGARPYYKMLDQLVAGRAVGLQGLHARRAELKADLVAMLVADQSLGGLAKRMGVPRPAFAPHAYSVVNYVVAASTWTLVHEIGHNLGCCHEKACYNPRPYGRGHSFLSGGRKYRTVMVRKSQPGTRIPYFSNASVTYGDVPTGTDSHDNARVIRENAGVVAAFY